MKTILEQMVEAYQPKNNEEKRNVVKEVMQEITLCALSKAGFFDVAAFYGGTALRIFYGLDRFSEDLDFSLMMKNKDFDLSTYVPSLKRIVQSFGLNVEVEIKHKTLDSAIQSAFLKGDTIEQFLLFYPNDLVTGINKNEKVKIKFEIDTMPASLATYETKYRLLPMPYSIKLYDEASLFSGKIHAVICRSWKSRVKGRDLYDYVFYLTRNTKFNLDHLREKLNESHYISQEDKFDVDFVKALLIARFNEIDFNDAKKDVLPFITDTSILDIWSKEFFISITSQLSNV
ncbi:nucleotidyl transferase AbiEii/AbiGii toxin family protein [uncultured Holdemanella sp.]|uniref:nucleotidyl transferase AbiEii/AbiGii toxin family protein n=1 Tax=uncultured Holdemanella sp. TaxID=1763549 RepID=UPI0025D0357A|nr:nucleotidyl transferase AbiEii/AbiGii toxin family protein [uncultured Holdemanella sp.]